MKIKTKRGPRRTRNQRVIDRRFVVTDYEGCLYITAGKLYRITDYCRTINDTGMTIVVRHVGYPAAHLDYIGAWYHPIR